MLDIQCYFDETTNTASYLVIEPQSKSCAVIDPVLGFDMSASRTSTQFVDHIISDIKAKTLKLNWILDTHAHADHISAAQYLKNQLGGQVVIGEHIVEVQKIFRSIFNLSSEFVANGSQFDLLVNEHSQLPLGELVIRVLETPGHTPACVSYVIGDNVFVGDTLFMPDYGTARCDFPGGDAATLYRSIHKLYQLADETHVYVGHDYKAANRDYFAWHTTIGEQKRNNIQINQTITEEQFITMREQKDSTLNPPKLILPSVQINIRAGNFPPPEQDGYSYLKLPLNKI